MTTIVEEWAQDFVLFFTVLSFGILCRAIVSGSIPVSISSLENSRFLYLVCVRVFLWTCSLQNRPELSNFQADFVFYRNVGGMTSMAPVQICV